MPSEVWSQYEANPRDFIFLAAYSVYKAEKEEAARKEAEAKYKTPSRVGR